MGMRGIGLGAALLLAGCTPQEPFSVETAALGEPSGDYPAYDERVVLYITNRARTDPAKEGWSSYPAQPPLQWNLSLNQSSRAHSIDMRDTPCFQHESCNGTDPFIRINTYYTASYSTEGENISAGVPDGVTAVHNWIYEIGAAAGETGHRDNIFSKDFTLLGAGFALGGSQFQNYWTQDFVGTTVTRPALTDGIHFPAKASSGKSLTFGESWYDSAGKAPTKISVVVDGKCHDLSLMHGAAGVAAYEASLALTDGCHPYYFRATSASGKTSLYPDTGSLQAGWGSAGASCTLFASSQAPADCAGAVPLPDMATAPDLAKPAMTGHDAGHVDSPSDGGAGAGDLSRPSGILMPGDVAGDPRGDASGCAVGGKAGVPALPLLLLASLLLLRRRRPAES